MAARLDGLFALTAGALDVDPERGVSHALDLGIPGERAYPNWQSMLAGESARADRLDLVTVATPNSTHYEISKAFLEAGFPVLCEKPMTVTVDEAESLARTAAEVDRLLAVNFGYTGYAMIRQARAMVQRGELGNVRVVVVEFAHGFHGNEDDADNPRLRWRYDPELVGESAVLADCGIHASHLATYVTGQSIESVSADFLSSMVGRELEDDAQLCVRFSGGTRGRIWTSAIAVGQVHGLNIRVFGSRGGLRWSQEFPNQLFYTPIDGPTQTLERGSSYLHHDATASSRITTGHPEGLVAAIGNVYRDLHHALTASSKPIRASHCARLPMGDAGVHMAKLVRAAVASAKSRGQWTGL